MPNVRVPEVGKPLLVFCKPWAAKLSNACFGTYAEMIMFAAGVGFRNLAGTPAPACTEFIDSGQPYPIDFGVFKSTGQQLYSLVLLLGLVSSGSHDVVGDDERLARIVENYAAIGMTDLVSRLSATTPEEFHVELAQLLVTAAK